MGRKSISWIVILVLFTVNLWSQDIPQHVSYSRIYDFIDELSIDKIIDVNTAMKPYSRKFIAQKLKEAQAQDSLLNNRQKKDLQFFLNDYALECDTVPRGWVRASNNKSWEISLLQPAFHFYNKNFKFRVSPIIGMDLIGNQNGLIIKRWYGADLQATIVNHIALYANYRDNSFNGNHLKNGLNPLDARIARPQYLNNIVGAEYKESEYGGDFSDMRGGVKLYTWWGSIGLIKDNIVWGDSYNSSNIISGRAPSFPMLTLNLKPVRWLEFNYIHGWLVSNVIDSSYYYTETYDTDKTKIHYRPKNKFIAANMLTFTPIKHLNISLGNSIVYSERNVQAAYFIPLAYYKSIDHLLTKGTRVENQNSQIFFNISTRNLKHVHFYGSLFVDEFSFKRLKKSNKEHNIYSYKLGAKISNWPLKNVSLLAEFTRTSPVCYQHSIESLTWASNSYNLGHYLGANSQEIYVSLNYKPIRSLNLKLSYTNARHGNEYNYIRRQVTEVISQKTLKDLTWQNNNVQFEAIYEVCNNAYAVIRLDYNHTNGYVPSSQALDCETRLSANEYVDLFTPKFYQGKNNVTCTLGFSFGF